MKKNSPSSLLPVAKPVESLLLICEKCGQKQMMTEQENPSQALQKHLKMRIREAMKPGAARTVTTSCLSICPVDAITVGYVGCQESSPSPEFYLLPKMTTDEASDLLFEQFFLKKVGGSS